MPGDRAHGPAPREPARPSRTERERPSPPGAVCAPRPRGSPTVRSPNQPESARTSAHVQAAAQSHSRPPGASGRSLDPGGHPHRRQGRMKRKGSRVVRGHHVDHDQTRLRHMNLVDHIHEQHHDPRQTTGSSRGEQPLDWRSEELSDADTCGSAVARPAPKRGPVGSRLAGVDHAVLLTRATISPPGLGATRPDGHATRGTPTAVVECAATALDRASATRPEPPEGDGVGCSFRRRSGAQL